MTDMILYDCNPNTAEVIAIVSFVVSFKLILNTWDSFSKQVLIST